jgi:P-type conjugative transfer protein TrbL
MIKHIIIALVMLVQVGISFAQSNRNVPQNPFSFSASQQQNLPSARLPLPTMSSIRANQNQPTIALPLQGSSLEGLALPDPNSRDRIMTEHDEKNTVLDNLTDKITNKLSSKLNEYAQVLIKAALKILMYLCGFVVCIRLIAYFKRGDGDFIHALIDLFVMVLTYKIVVAFIIASPQISDNIINWFKEVGGLATGRKGLSAGTIIDLGNDYFMSMLKAGFGFDLKKMITIYFIGSITWMTLILMTGLYVLAVIESLILAKFCIIMTGFHGLDMFKDISSKPLFIWIHIGLKLLFLNLIIGLEIDLLKDFLQSKNPEISDCIAAASISVIMFIITWRSPKIFTNMMNGQSSIASVNELTQAVSKMAKALPTPAAAVGGAIAGAMSVSQIVKAHQASQAAKSNINYSTMSNSGFSETKNSSNGINSNSSNSNLNSSSNSNINSSNGAIKNSSNDNSTSAIVSRMLNPSTQSSNASISNISNVQNGINSSQNNNDKNNVISNNIDNNKNNGNTNNSGGLNNNIMSNAGNQNTNDLDNKKQGFIANAIKSKGEMIYNKYNDAAKNMTLGKIAQHINERTEKLQQGQNAIKANDTFGYISDIKKQNSSSLNNNQSNENNGKVGNIIQQHNDDKNKDNK